MFEEVGGRRWIGLATQRQPLPKGTCVWFWPKKNRPALFAGSP